MSLRVELIEIVTRDSISSGGDEVWATDFVAAFRAEILREAAEKIYNTTISARVNARGDEYGDGYIDGGNAAGRLIDPDVVES